MFQLERAHGCASSRYLLGRWASCMLRCCTHAFRGTHCASIPSFVVVWPRGGFSGINCTAVADHDGNHIVTTCIHVSQCMHAHHTHHTHTQTYTHAHTHTHGPHRAEQRGGSSENVCKLFGGKSSLVRSHILLFTFHVFSRFTFHVLDVPCSTSSKRKT